MASVELPVISSGSKPGSGWPLLRLGFRPFYLGAAGFAALAMPLWMAMLYGGVSLPRVMAPMVWHAHEMLFGFAVTVIIGFLLTAGKAWTGLATPRGGHLAALVLLWLGARIAALFAPYALYAALDVALLPWVAAVFTHLLIRARNLRNLPVAGILWLLGFANAAFHLSLLGMVQWSPMQAVHAALALVVMMACVIAGRVVPAFTMSATPGLRLVTSSAMERATLASTALGLACWIFLPTGLPGALLLGVSAALHVERQRRWQPWVTHKRPILWILHAAYAWLPVGLGLLAMAQLGWVQTSLGIHALAVGLTGGLIIGMMVRTARGHTARPIQTSRRETLAFILVLSAAAIRVFVPLAMPQSIVAALLLAAACWTLAFLAYLFTFAPWLCSARLDGKDG